MKNVLLLLALIACNKTNPNYCADHPDHNCNEPIDAPIDTAANCSTAGCVTGVCETTSNTCVQCTAAQPQACMAATPVCGSDDTCRKCAAHSECTSDACLPTGACGGNSDVAYVAPTGVNNASCTKAMPCLTVAAGILTGKTYVKLTGMLSESVTLVAGTVTLLADPNTQLTTTTAGPVLAVSGTANVSIYDLDVHAGGSIGDGIDMTTGTPTLALHHVSVDHASADGISAQAGTLTIDRSTISGNLAGGIDLHAAFDIQNTFITQNGGASSAFGGMQIVAAGSTHRLEFTTIANNGGNASVFNGVTCTGFASAVTFSNNIIYGNINDQQVNGSNCVFTFSDIGPTSQPGSGNMNMAPSFVNAATGDFHLMTASPVKDQADPAATLPYDFDGNPRPQNVHDDMGADEIMQ